MRPAYILVIALAGCATAPQPVKYDQARAEQCIKAGGCSPITREELQRIMEKEYERGVSDGEDKDCQKLRQFSPDGWDSPRQIRGTR
jgi:hypothetical protein